MSLLLLKTRDLSHQDHTLNFEIMLNPTGSGLLLNKHRGLETRREKTKQVCEVERRFALKQHAIDQRLVFRKRRELLNRMANKRSYTAELEKADALISERGRSAPVVTVTSKKRGIKPPRMRSAVIDNRKSNITKLPDLLARKTHTNKKASNAFLTEASNLIAWTIPKEGQLETTQLQNYVTSESTCLDRHVHNLKSVKFDDRVDTKIIQEEEFRQLNSKMTRFMEKIEEYRTRPAKSFFAKEQNNVNNWMVEMAANTSVKNAEPLLQPLVSRRYSKINLDIKKLSSAFDQFCMDGKGIENLHKIIKLASKLKASTKCARNVSMLPVIGAMKTKRILMSGISEDQK